MSRSTDARPDSRHPVPDRPRDLVPGRQLVDEALAGRVEEPSALAPDRLGDEEALAPGDAGDRGRVELRELEVGERRAGLPGEEQPDAERPRRVRRPRPERRRAAGGEDDAARPDRPAVLAHDADAAPVDGPQRGGARALEDDGRRASRDERGQVADDAAPGRAAAGVDDAAVRVAALEAEREVAVAVGVEAHPERARGP